MKYVIILTLLAGPDPYASPKIVDQKRIVGEYKDLVSCQLALSAKIDSYRKQERDKYYSLSCSARFNKGAYNDQN